MSNYQQQQPYQNMPQTSTTAIISLIAGIISWVMIPLLGAIVAIITGHMAKREIRESMGRLTGEGLATFGLVLGYAQIAFGLLCLCTWLVLMIFGVSLPFLMDGGY
jgi:hypothetical protein